MDTPNTAATRQFDGLVLVRVKPTKLSELRALLAAIGQQTLLRMQGRGGPAEVKLPFEKLQTVHFARLVLVEAPGQAPLLAFSTNFDGVEGEPECSRARALSFHLAELCREAGPALEEVFAHCEGFRAGDLAGYLKRHQRVASTFYVGSSGRSKKQIAWEANLRRRVEAALDAVGLESAPPELVRERVLQELARDPAYAQFLDGQGQLDLPPFPAQPDNEPRISTITRRLIAAVVLLYVLVCAAIWLWAPMPEQFLHADWSSRALRTGAAAALGLAAFAAVAVPLYARFRHLEETDPQFQVKLSDATHHAFRVASADENYFLQNQLTHVVRLKAGPLRWLLIRVVFWALQ
ncbi:MAG TPA: hypothetical protein VEQ59_23220, partial [Polyangiaceae bacterium]|nr:hypothetical protein [Polyangiaceae bacterium]